MAKIIRKNFTESSFKKMVDKFPFSGKRVSLPMEKLNAIVERLYKESASFQKVFHAYFESKDNTRYNNLTGRMELFIKKIHKYNSGLKGEERKIFALFWNEVAEIIKKDCVELQDRYLTNSCNYFIYEIDNLA